ncbi:MAG TPA: zf-HC2 domain-containing protein [Gemmatimonadales bacterium]
MSPMPGHLEIELQDLLDGRLEAARRPEIEAHLAACERCRRHLDALRWARDVALKQVPIEALPPGLAARVGAALDAEAAKERQARHPSLLRRSRRPLLMAATLAAAAAILFLVSRRSPDGIVLAVASDFLSVRRQGLLLETESSDPVAIEQFFRASGITFRTRVFDLAMMQYRLTGGRVHSLQGRPSALFVYRGPSDRTLVCQMYQGKATDLGAPDESRENDGITFSVFRQGPLTLVFWEEGDVLCVLASDAPAEEVIQLAYAKAVKV